VVPDDADATPTEYQFSSLALDVYGIGPPSGIRLPSHPQRRCQGAAGPSWAAPAEQAKVDVVQRLGR